MKDLKQYQFWFITGSQHLYGEDVIKTVEEHSKQMVEGLTTDPLMPATIVFKTVATTPDEITRICQEANYDENCAGIITWCHTFSPSKMWISGLTKLQKPWLHLHTQFNRTIPVNEIDMDFMNLNQSAHGDREHGFIGTRLRIARKIVVGYWEDVLVREKIGNWMRSAIGVAVSRSLKVVRYGDNMRYVAVTEGDKVEAEIKLGWQVNTRAVGDLVNLIETVTEEEIDELMAQYQEKYDINTDQVEQVRYQAKIQLGIQRSLELGGFGAFTTTFEDLYGLNQLPGLACQDLMSKGYGFGGEGDWKVSAMTHIMKAMAQGLNKGTSFMEDYTYDLTENQELILGAHMLEVCPTVAANRPKIEVHELGIGNKTENCAGIITWCHTFSPSKMWISGLTKLQKPWLHLHTQFNRTIPVNEIDMDFMNLNQSAHGDREHGFIGTRLRIARKIVVGYWEDVLVREKIGNWMRSAIGVAVSRSLKVVRYGDNMRYVAVTEGDKVEAEIKLGWQVNTRAVGDLVNLIETVTEEEIDELMAQYQEKYDINTDQVEQVRYQAKIQLGIQRSLELGGFGAFTTTFEDLYGLNQLPGLACQDLMSKGYGFGGEGDWKVSAMTHIMKAMAQGLNKGTSFMEDYTYDLTENQELILGAHMLEVCPTVAANRPKIEVHELGIGNKTAPARLVFDGKSGSAIVASLVDMGGRLRLIVNDIECVEPFDMPNLPVAGVMWRPEPSLQVSASTLSV